MRDVPDHPDIVCAERTGYPPWNDGKVPICPVCGVQCETIYKDWTGDIVGCDDCITARDAWEELVDE